MKKRKEFIILSIVGIIVYVLSVLLFFYTGAFDIVGALIVSAIISLVVLWKPFSKKVS